MNRLCETNQSFKIEKIICFIEYDEHDFKKVIIKVLPHAFICKCPLYHPFSSKDFPLAFISEDFGGACPSPGLNGLLSPTQFPDIFFICVLKNSNFFYVHVYRIYSFFSSVFGRTSRNNEYA